MKAFIGIDVSKEKLDVAVLSNGNIIACGEFGNTKSGTNTMRKWAKKQCGRGTEIIFGCEASGIYHSICAQTLFDAKQKVVVINPRFTKHELEAMGRKNKTDKVDAEVIAIRLSREIDPLWNPPSESIQLLRDLMLRRDQLVRSITVEKGRAERYRKDSIADDSVKRMLKFLEQELAEIERKIETLIKSDEELDTQTRIGDTVPGVGPVVARVFIAAVGDVNDFADADQVQSYLGICSQQRISGKSLNRSWMSKRGNQLLRKTLYMGAMATATRSKNSPYRQYYESLIARGKSEKAAIAAVMRKIVRALYAVLRDGVPFSIARYAVPPHELKQC